MPSTTPANLHRLLDEMKVGQGAFIPCLDTDLVRQHVLRVALPYRYKISLEPGVHQGLFGLHLTRVR